MSKTNRNFRNRKCDGCFVVRNEMHEVKRRWIYLPNEKEEAKKVC